MAGDLHGGGCLESVDLVTLMLQKAGEHLFQGALAIAESEAVLWGDRVQLGVAELGKATERAASGCKLPDHGAEIKAVCRVKVVGMGRAGPAVGSVRGFVTLSAEQPGDPMSPVPGRLALG